MCRWLGVLTHRNGTSRGASLATLGLHAVVEPASPQVLWMVDGRPFAVADYPYTARWPLTPGEHVIQARLPFTDIASTPVKVLVQ